MTEAELILNPDGSIYHLNLLPEDIASTIILVGDPGRVQKVSKFFRTIDLIKQKREFITHTGWVANKRVTVISTGIGTDNIDIVINELDALANIDLSTRQVKKELTPLNLIRIGTSGSVHPDVTAGSIVISHRAIGIDLLGKYYGGQPFVYPSFPEWSYQTSCFPFDLSSFSIPYHEGVTLTCAGFYGPQSRNLRAPAFYPLPEEELYKIPLDRWTITNLEMETAAIYLLAERLGHKALSFNDILAERLAGKFSTQPGKSIDKLIEAVMQWVIKVED